MYSELLGASQIYSNDALASGSEGKTSLVIAELTFALASSLPYLVASTVLEKILATMGTFSLIIGVTEHYISE